MSLSLTEPAAAATARRNLDRLMVTAQANQTELSAGPASADLAALLADCQTAMARVAGVLPTILPTSSTEEPRL